MEVVKSVHGQAAFDCLVQILQQLFEGLAMSGAAWNGRYLGPKSAFVGLMNDDLDLNALPPLDLLDLVGLGAARRHHLDVGALGLADERARERRGDRDL